MSDDFCTVVREPDFGDEAIYDHRGKLLYAASDGSGYQGGISPFDLARHGCETVERRDAAEGTLEWEDEGYSPCWPAHLDLIALEPCR